jgi:hypothetical protein
MTRSELGSWSFARGMRMQLRVMRLSMRSAVWLTPFNKAHGEFLAKSTYV